MRKCLEIKAGGQKYALRLTASAQMSLRERFEEETMETVLSVTSDLERLCALLEAALTWKGNENPIHDGEEFYDLLVDENYSGMSDFGKLAIDIAVSSGILTKEQAEKAGAYLNNAIEGAFETFDTPKENPTMS